MSSLYEIDQQIIECLDTDTGEILDAEKLDALMIERNEKIEAVTLCIKNLTSDAIAYEAEILVFKERKERAEKKAESLKKWLADALCGQKFSTTRCAVNFRKSEKIEISDESQIPKEYMKESVTYTPDKKAIKAAIKAGQAINGCCLVENQNIIIK